MKNSEKNITLISAGIKACGGLAKLPEANFYIDCRGLPDPSGHHQGPGSSPITQLWMSEMINVDIYLHVVLDAIKMVEERRKHLDWPWEAGFKICFFCAWGVHRSVALKCLIAQRLRGLGYNVIAPEAGGVIIP